jgi:hypothetical protein
VKALPALDQAVRRKTAAVEFVLETEFKVSMARTATPLWVASRLPPEIGKK